MRVLVTGATGFLGGALCRRLSQLDHEVIALGRDSAKLAVLESRGLRTVAVDLASSAVSLNVAADAVVHCAALSSPWGRAADFHRANVVGTQAALDLARRCGAQRFVHISTPSIYFRFADQIGVREDMALPHPVNAYARTKREAEALVMRSTDLDPIVLRPRGLYGSGDVALLPRLLAAARKRPLPLLNGGRAVTDLTHVDDVVDAISATLSLQRTLSQRVFNISGGAALNVRDVAEKTAQRAGVRLRWREMPTGLVMALARASEAASAVLPGHPEPPVTTYSVGLFAYSQTLDISAAQQHLGWRPRISFDKGLELTFHSEAA
jgi:nucleoside-diphosphate-sugar epimerase